MVILFLKKKMKGKMMNFRWQPLLKQQFDLSKCDFNCDLNSRSLPFFVLNLETIHNQIQVDYLKKKKIKRETGKKKVPVLVFTL